MPSAMTRGDFSIGVGLCNRDCIVGASSGFVSYFLNFIFALLFIMVPWAVINLMDFYLINKQSYDIDSIFAHDGGIYGKFNGKALCIYFIGILIQVPFLTNSSLLALGRM
jgi:NCS1 family nucleobase:cation symporter-1